MQSSPNHHYKIEIIVRDTSDDVHGIYEDIEHLLGGYDIRDMDIYEIHR